MNRKLSSGDERLFSVLGGFAVTQQTDPGTALGGGFRVALALETIARAAQNIISGGSAGVDFQRPGTQPGGGSDSDVVLQ